jgi:hypothetical protein
MDSNTTDMLHTPTRIFESVFDFPAAQPGHGQNQRPLSLIFGNTSDTNTDNHHLLYTSNRFAQQLDTAAINEQSQFMDNEFNATAELTSLFLQSTKFTETHNFDSIINTYLTFTKISNIPARDVVDSFKRSIISSLKLDDTVSICTEMGYELSEPGRFEKLVENVYGDYSEWEKILHTLAFDEDAVHEYLFTAESDFGHNRPTIKFVIDKLEQIGVDNVNVTDTLKIYLLTNIKNVISLVAIKAFLTEIMPATFNTTEAANIFTAAMADTRFTQTQFSNDLTWLMQNLIISVEFQEKCIFFMETKESMFKWSQRENTKQHQTTGRVRLRYRVGPSLGRSVLPDADPIHNNIVDNYGCPSYTQKVQNIDYISQTSQLHEDSLQGWSLRARVPPAISHKSKLLGYVLMAQINFADPSDAIRKHFTDTEIASNILANRLCKPQASTIIEFLHLLTFHVTPFEKLIAFRTECFMDFSHTDSKDLSWLKLLQLYIASYQDEDIWPEIWKNFCKVLSHQVLIAVRNFKNKHIYEVDVVAEICMQTEQSSRKNVNEIQ